jgi:hypothetical protein
VSSQRQQAEGDLDRQTARLREHVGAGMVVFASAKTTRLRAAVAAVTRSRGVR